MKLEDLKQEKVATLRKEKSLQLKTERWKERWDAQEIARVKFRFNFVSILHFALKTARKYAIQLLKMTFLFLFRENRCLISWKKRKIVKKHK